MLSGIESVALIPNVLPLEHSFSDTCTDMKVANDYGISAMQSGYEVTGWMQSEIVQQK